LRVNHLRFEHVARRWFGARGVLGGDFERFRRVAVLTSVNALIVPAVDCRSTRT
jgi:hypothetical protein